MAENLATYEGEDIADIIRDSVSYGDPSERLVFLMGPYRLLDPAYLYPETDFSLPSDPLAPAESTVEPDLIESTLREVADRISRETPTTVFIASDIDIPTRREVAEQELDEPGMPVIDQSVAFAKASAGNVFVFTKAGLTTGVGSETGAVPEYFELRDPDARSRDPRTFCILAEAERTGGEQNEYNSTFSSASINEMDDAYDLRFRYFEDRDELIDKITTFVESYVIPLSEST
jgi:hypothetical protein